MRLVALCTIALAAARADAGSLRQAVVGEPGFQLLYARAKRFCGGFEVRAVRTEHPIADVDTATLFLLEPPPKLGLDAKPMISARELERFSSWRVRLLNTLAMIQKRADAATDDIAAQAHTIVAERYAVELLLRTAVPKTLADGDEPVIDAFCDGIGVMADPIIDDIEYRLTACRALLPNADPGFWDTVCTR